MAARRLMATTNGRSVSGNRCAKFSRSIAKFFLFQAAPPRTRWLWRNCAVPFTASFATRTHTFRRTNAAHRSFSAAAQSCFRRKGANGKLDLAEVESTIARQAELHAQKPRVLSITQATELGTVYTIEEVRAAGEFARKHGLRLHMDGARFANAIAALNCAPKTISWEAGVDVLCFGGTKNGGAGSELVIFFQKQLAAEFDYRVKQAGQLASKMRFLAAPWIGLLQNDVWLGNAAKANGCGQIACRQIAGAWIGDCLPMRCERTVRANRRSGRRRTASTRLAVLQVHRARHLSTHVFMVGN